MLYLPAQHTLLYCNPAHCTAHVVWLPLFHINFSFCRSLPADCHISLLGSQFLLLFCTPNCTWPWGWGTVRATCDSGTGFCATPPFQYNFGPVFFCWTLNLTEVYSCFFLSCKANARIKLAKTGDGPHSSTLVVICVVLLLFVLFCVLFVCKCALSPGDNPTAVNKYIVSYILFLSRKQSLWAWQVMQNCMSQRHTILYLPSAIPLVAHTFSILSTCGHQPGMAWLTSNSLAYNFSPSVHICHIPSTMFRFSPHYLLVHLPPSFLA